MAVVGLNESVALGVIQHLLGYDLRNANLGKARSGCSPQIVSAPRRKNVIVSSTGPASTYGAWEAGEVKKRQDYFVWQRGRDWHCSDSPWKDSAEVA